MDRKVGEVFYSELLQCYLEVVEEIYCGHCFGCAYYNTPYCTNNTRGGVKSLEGVLILADFMVRE